MAWHIGNTTVRTPYRLIGALEHLPNSKFNGALSGKEDEAEFALFLDELGLVSTNPNGNYTDLLGRKWRSALYQLGFITPLLSSRWPSGKIDPKLKPVTDLVDGLTGRQYEVTPSGLRLGKSKNILEQQDCFLRTLAAYQCPSIVEKGQGQPFSPLKHSIRILLELERRIGSSRVSFEEFALVVQNSTSAEDIVTICDRLITLRSDRASAARNVAAFDRSAYADASAVQGVLPETLRDYADLSMRYLKATGIFQSAGRGISLSPGRRLLAELLAAETAVISDPATYLVRLWRGADLPTDNLVESMAIVEDLRARLEQRGVATATLPATTDQKQIDTYRFGLETQLRYLDEQEYADQQKDQFDEITCWLSALASGRKVTGPAGQFIMVPKGEAPAYLEWALWRAFLAINGLVNKPWEARRFQIDQDFLPVGCAPGGGPDAFFEFDDNVIVLEATLSDSSRQEAMEGEPVRRHVADFEKRYDGTGKKVYGLFVARNINSNTAHTFRMGEWYLPDDSDIYLDIVPVRLDQLIAIFQARLTSPGTVRVSLLQLLSKARQLATRPAPKWKTLIAEIVEQLNQDPA